MILVVIFIHIWLSIVKSDSHSQGLSSEYRGISFYDDNIVYTSMHATYSEWSKYFNFNISESRYKLPSLLHLTLACRVVNKTNTILFRGIIFIERNHELHSDEYLTGPHQHSANSDKEIAFVIKTPKHWTVSPIKIFLYEKLYHIEFSMMRNESFHKSKLRHHEHHGKSISGVYRIAVEGWRISGLIGDLSKCQVMDHHEKTQAADIPVIKKSKLVINRFVYGQVEHEEKDMELEVLSLLDFMAYHNQIIPDAVIDTYSTEVHIKYYLKHPKIREYLDEGKLRFNLFRLNNPPLPAIAPSYMQMYSLYGTVAMLQYWMNNQFAIFIDADESLIIRDADKFKQLLLSSNSQVFAFTVQQIVCGTCNYLNNETDVLSMEKLPANQIILKHHTYLFHKTLKEQKVLVRPDHTSGFNIHRAYSTITHKKNEERIPISVASVVHSYNYHNIRTVDLRLKINSTIFRIPFISMLELS